LRDIVARAGDLLGKSELIRLGALPTRPDETPLLVGRNTRLLSETDWQPTFDLETGLQDTIDWWRQVL
jgi:nucleoside-diphosphate-sugar epimerase